MRRLLFAYYAFATLFCFNVFEVQSVRAQDVDTANCVTPSLREAGELRHYSIKAKSNPPSRILIPGETYQILYKIETGCDLNCGKVKQHILSHRAVLGADRIKIQTGSHVVTGASTIARHACGSGPSRTLTFKVPSFQALGARGDGVETVSMGVCPPFINKQRASRKNAYVIGFNCAGHTIRVRNVSRSGWKVSALKTRQRTIGSGVNRVAAYRSIALSATVSRTSGWSIPGQGPMIEIRQVTSSVGPINRTPLSPMPAPNLGAGASAQVQFTLRGRPPGVYAFKACLTGLKQDNWPAPDVCGSPTAITVGVPAASGWNIGKIHKTSQTTPFLAEVPFNVFTILENISSADHPVGGRFAILWQRKHNAPSSTTRIRKKEIRYFRAGVRGTIGFKDIVLNAGQWELRACLSDNPSTSQLNSVCGPWTPIRVGIQKSRPVTQPVAPIVNSCTGGRSKNTSGRCVCPSGSNWNPNPGFKRCYTCTKGRIWDRYGRRCVCTWGKSWNVKAGRCVKPARVQCPPTFVRHRIKNTCICRRGYTKIGNSCRRKPADSGATIKRPNCTGGRSLNASGRCVCPTGKRWNARLKRCASAVRVTCRLPFVRNPSTNRCICRKGYFKIGNSCRRKPKNGATQSSRPSGTKRPARTVNRKRCIGGKMKGSLCWCGLGKFPKRVSKYVYRCQ